MTQITIRPTPYHLTLPDNAPLKETAQIGLAHWMKLNSATDLQHLDEDRGFTVIIDRDRPHVPYVKCGLDHHYTATLPDGSAIGLENLYIRDETPPVVRSGIAHIETHRIYQEAANDFATQLVATSDWKARVRSWLKGSR